MTEEAGEGPPTPEGPSRSEPASAVRENENSSSTAAEPAGEEELPHAPTLEEEEDSQPVIDDWNTDDGGDTGIIMPYVLLLWNNAPYRYLFFRCVFVFLLLSLELWCCS